MRAPAPRPFRPAPPLAPWRRPPETPRARLLRLATDAAFMLAGWAMTVAALWNLIGGWL